MKEEIYILFIGFILGIVSIIISNQLNRIGKIKVYARLVASKSSNDSWGFYESDQGLFFQVPLWIELQNTSNTPRIMRDFNVVLYNNGKEVRKMKQITHLTSKGKPPEFFANEGWYSFILPPRSIQKFDCYYVIKSHDQFNEIRLKYFDEKDRAHILPFKSVPCCWELGSFPKDDSWHLIVEQNMIKSKSPAS